MSDVKLNGIYYHFKGNFYKVLGFAKDSESGADMVVYKALYGSGQEYVRSKEMFTEQIDANGSKIDRFHLISPDALKWAYCESGINSTR